MYTKHLVLFALMVSFAGAQQLKDFEGVYLSRRDSTYPIPVVLKIEQAPKGLTFTKYEQCDIHQNCIVITRTYTINGKYVRDVIEHSKRRVAFKKNTVRIDTVTDSSGIATVNISAVFGGGVSRKTAEEWSLAPDLQTLTLKIREEVQSVQIPLCDSQDSQMERDLCKQQTAQMTVYGIHDNDRSKKISERVYKRRRLLSEAIAEATEKN